MVVCAASGKHLFPSTTRHRCASSSSFVTPLINSRSAAAGEVCRKPSNQPERPYRNNLWEDRPPGRVNLWWVTELEGNDYAYFPPTHLCSLLHSLFSVCRIKSSLSLYRIRNPIRKNAARNLFELLPKKKKQLKESGGWAVFIMDWCFWALALIK